MTLETFQESAIALALELAECTEACYTTEQEFDIVLQRVKKREITMEHAVYKKAVEILADAVRGRIEEFENHPGEKSE